MARPRKEGMEYFPHDTDAANDKKIKALRILYGNDGYTFYFVLLEMIYREPTFELDVSDAETIQILSKECGINEELFTQILHTAIKRDCFDREAYEDREVLTSNGIKKRASVVIDKRVKMRESHAKKVSDSETLAEMPQSKSKSKVKVKVKEKVIKILHGSNVLLSEIEYQKLVEAQGEDVVKECIEFLDSYKIEKDYKTKSDYQTILRWVIDAVIKKNLKVIGGGQNNGFKQNGKVSSFARLQQMAREENEREASGGY